MKLKAILCLATMTWLLMLPVKGNAQTTKTIVVNEIMVSNVGDVISPAINFDGWVELYNPTDQAVSISGFYVSDDATNLKCWQLPSSTGTIPAKGFKVIWFGSNDIKNDQVPFKLNCDGGIVCLSDASGNLIVNQEYPTAISHTAYARKTDGGNDWGWTSTATPGKSNATAVFASQRLEAPIVSTDSKLFTGSLNIKVNIPEGARLMYTTDGSLPSAPKSDTEEEKSPWTQWVKNGDCEGSDASCFVCRDGGLEDGDKTWKSIHRITDNVGVNGSRGIIVHSVANAPNEWNTQFFVYTPEHTWKTGEHYRFHMKVRADKATTISIQAHKEPGDYITGGMLNGKNYNVTTGWTEIDYEGNITSSQAGESGGNWWGGGEVTYSLQTIAFNLNVDKNTENNFYFDEISWESMDDEVEEESTQESKDGQFAISKTTNYTFRLFQDGYLPSIPVTRSYIQTSNQYTLPIISIVGDKKFFTDPKIGFDCDGDGTNGKTGNGQNSPKNYNQDWDRPVNFSFISPEGDMLFNQDVNISVSGGWTRAQRYRSFKLKSNKIFDGQNRFDYSFFPQKPYIRNKALLVRNGGNDIWTHNARFLDPALETIIQRSGIDLDVQSYVPIIEYVNGELRGVLNLRETNNDKFAYANWGYDDEELDAFENLKMKNGDDVVINQIYELGKKATDDNAYENLKKLLDIDEFTNYMAVTMFLDNNDWPNNNIKAYRSRNDGRYRFVSFDLDYAFQLRNFCGTDDNPFEYFLQFKDVETVGNEGNQNREIVSLFFNLLERDDYRRKFIDTFCLVGGSIFEPTRANAIVDELLAKVKPMCDLMKQQGITDGHDPDRAASTIKSKLSGRSKKMAGHLKDFSYAKLSSSAQAVTLKADTDGALLTVNGINVPYADFKGHLFAPVTLEAKAPAGYQFAGWKDNNSGSIVNSNTSYNMPEDATVSLTATFTKLSDKELVEQHVAPLRINEVSAGNGIYVSDWFKRDDWFEIYNTTDTDLDVAGLYVSNDEDNPLKYQIPADGVINTIIPAGEHRIVWADEMDPVSQLHANFKLKNEDDQLILLCSSDDFVANNTTFFDKHPEMISFADGIIYTAHRSDQTVGRYPDGGKSLYKMYRPTIECPNALTTADLFLGEDNGLSVLDRETFTLELAEGWNWMSHPMAESIATSKLSDQAKRIVGKNSEAYKSTSGMVGTLKDLEAGNLYKVQMQQADTYTHSGFFCEDGRPIMLHPGWNWIGYTVNGVQAINTALSDYMAEEGEKIISQNGIATYENGKWQGTLSTLETGMGYMLFTNQAKSLTFKSTSVKVRLRHRTKSSAARTRTPSLFRPVSKHTYPNVMGIIAELQKDNEKVEADRFTLFAYDTDGECRGEGKWVDGLAYLTLYGKGGENLSYRAVDLLDGTVYTVRETMSFAEGVTGSLGQPFVLTLGKMEGNATMIDGTPVAPSSSEIDSYYNLNGTRISVTTGRRGIYLVKYKDGSYRKLIVK